MFSLGGVAFYNYFLAVVLSWGLQGKLVFSLSLSLPLSLSVSLSLSINLSISPSLSLS